MSSEFRDGILLAAVLFTFSIGVLAAWVLQQVELRKKQREFDSLMELYVARGEKVNSLFAENCELNNEYIRCKGVLDDTVKRFNQQVCEMDSTILLMHSTIDSLSKSREDVCRDADDVRNYMRQLQSLLKQKELHVKEAETKWASARAELMLAKSENESLVSQLTYANQKSLDSCSIIRENELLEARIKMYESGIDEMTKSLVAWDDWLKACPTMATLGAIPNELTESVG